PILTLVENVRIGILTHVGKPDRYSMARKFGVGLVFFVAALGLAGLGAWYVFCCADRPQPNGPPGGPGVPTAEGSLDQRFTTRVQPFVQRYCFSCHGPKKQEAGLDLSRDATAEAVADDLGHWLVALERLRADEMPPEDAPRRPAPDERGAVVTW